jgi:hypothetical protein
MARRATERGEGKVKERSQPGKTNKGIKTRYQTAQVHIGGVCAESFTCRGKVIGDSEAGKRFKFA